MATVHEEIELKYAAEPDQDVPPLSQLLGAGSVPGSHLPVVAGDPVEHRLEATYYDTSDLRLARAGLTLRRRTGGDDEGWHLKVPTSQGARSEVRIPLAGDGEVPAELGRMVWARTEGRALVPVARIATVRTVTRGVDASGRVVVEMADDQVTARRLVAPATAGSPDRRTWREVEIELVDGHRSLLTTIDARMRELGLPPGGSTSKLARLLDLGDQEASRRGDPPPRPAADGDGGDVLRAYLAAQVEQVRAHDVLVRLDSPDSVHRMRVATRRLRSALTTFAPLVAGDQVSRLKEELRWLAAELGTVRDAEVLRHRVTASIRAQADDDDRATTALRDVDAELGRRYRAAHVQLLTQLDGERYRDLLQALASLAERPELTEKAGRKASKALLPLVSRSHEVVRSRVAKADAETDPVQREERLHRVRKAAKRARYAAESVSEVFGKGAPRYAAAMEALQEALGEHQDSVLVRQRLAELASATTSAAAAFAYGRMDAQEELAAQDRQAHVVGAWRAANRKKLRRWMG